MDDCGCPGFATMFDRRTAERDRERYRRHGPDRTTTMLLDMIRKRGVGGTTVLDVGGGIGLVGRELLAAGASRAVLVDGSPAYLEVAHEEAEAAGVLDRLEMRPGDFVQEAERISSADTVVLDRVICCYPDVRRLVDRSAERASRLYGLVLPRDTWYSRLLIRLENVWHALRRRRFRGYAHRHTLVDARVVAAGLQPVEERLTPLWRVVLFERPATAAGDRGRAEAGNRGRAEAGVGRAR